MKIIASNKRANHNYFISSKIEAGIVLTGSEVKSLRLNTGSINESYIQDKNGELWLINCFIKKYSSSSDQENNPTRERKLLVNKKELNRLIGAQNKNGMTIIPINLHFDNKGLAKITIGLGKGKKKYDKRAAIKEKEWGIKQQRLLKKKSI
tara:strand:+ start:1559 stop:2011 length:453 start_codon:yes stop_codon:yes gene_type:complete